MSVVSTLRELDHDQRRTVLTSFLGWTLDAFDYFLLTFVIVGMANEFGVDKTEMTLALLLMLAARPFGALIFGRLADRYGRQLILMLDAVVAPVLALLAWLGPEARGVGFGHAPD